MTITIAPFTVDPNCGYAMSPFAYGKEEQIRQIRKEYMPITYWKIYMDDKYVSYTSSKELAENTKAWMEKWLKGKV